MASKIYCEWCGLELAEPEFEDEIQFCSKDCKEEYSHWLNRQDVSTDREFLNG